MIKKYTAMQLHTSTVNDVVQVRLAFGEIQGPYYSQEHPEKEFDTEEGAIQYAEKTDKYATWLIVPIFRFNY